MAVRAGPLGLTDMVQNISGLLTLYKPKQNILHFFINKSARDLKSQKKKKLYGVDPVDNRPTTG